MKIKHLDLIGMPVTDQQISLDFYTQKLGFEVRVNMEHFEIPGMRWIELVPPGADTAIVLSTWEEGRNPGIMILVTTDIEADYAELQAKGVNLPPLEHQPWGIFTPITDPDGNTLILQQATEFADSDANKA